MSGTSSLPPPPNTLDQSQLYRWLYLAYVAINNATGGGSSGDFGTPGINEPLKALVPNNSRALDFLQLTALNLNGTPIVSTASDINQLYQSGITRASLFDLQAYSAYGHSVVISVDEEDGSNTVHVVAQFIDVNGNVLASPVNGFAYLSDSDTGIGYTASVPDTGWLIGDGALTSITTATPTCLINFTTLADGFFSIDFMHTAAGTWYLVFIMPYGKLVVSSPIIFT